MNNINFLYIKVRIHSDGQYKYKTWRIKRDKPFTFPQVTTFPPRRSLNNAQTCALGLYKNLYTEVVVGNTHTQT